MSTDVTNKTGERDERSPTHQDYPWDSPTTFPLLRTLPGPLDSVSLTRIKGPVTRVVRSSHEGFVLLSSLVGGHCRTSLPPLSHPW